MSPRSRWWIPWPTRTDAIAGGRSSAFSSNDYSGTNTGANRVDLCVVTLLRAILGADSGKAARCSRRNQSSSNSMCRLLE
ncbi:hypothetical protein ACQP1K_03240 [Sphaerimonospora sp. CA-214678]|uniref:hypothetical protein n=1 Tax=Sphaerimonospora sp. CA-214678 TaxID=3240029 RepID=UPI003D8D2829